MTNKIVVLLMFFVAFYLKGEVIPENGNFLIDYRDIGIQGEPGFWVDRVYNSKCTAHGLFGWGWGSQLDTRVTATSEKQISVREFGCGANNTFDQQADGTFLSQNFGRQLIVKQSNGYKRTYEDGRVEYFDSTGKLIRLENKTDTQVFKYEGVVLTEIRDENGKKLKLNYDNNGTLKTIGTDMGTTTKYTFNAKGDLVNVVDANGNEYSYQYDQGGRHLLTKIKYSSGKVRSISYYGQDSYERVAKVINPDNSSAEYIYKDIGTDVSIKVIETVEKQKTESNYLYTYYDKDQTKIKSKSISSELRNQTELYDESGLLISRNDGMTVAKFKYDKEKRLTGRITPQEEITIFYQDNSNQIDKIVRVPTGSKKQKWTKFKYTKGGTISEILTSAGDKFAMSYDPKARVSEVKDNANGKTIRVAYNSRNQVVKLEDSKLGAFEIKYDDVKPYINGDQKKQAKGLEAIQTFGKATQLIRQGDYVLGY